MNVAISALRAPVDHHDGYQEFREAIAAHIAAQTDPVFTTSATALWELFLSHIPEASRQIYTCHACRHFVERCFGLVTIGEAGELHPAVLPYNPQVPPFFLPACHAIGNMVMRSRVTGVFLTDHHVLGTPETPPWAHLSAPTVPVVWRNTNRTQTAGQVMAEKKEDHRMLQDALRDFSQEAVTQALRVIHSDQMYRSAQVEGVATWLDTLHATLRDEGHRPVRQSLLWQAVATAPAGFCHVRSTMIGTLLEDIIAYLPFADITRRFAAKMHPLQYRRPTAPLTAGNMAQAETIMQQMGSAGALARRFATLADVEALWQPTVREAATPAQKLGSLFGHLLAMKSARIPTVEVPPRRLTWEKFTAEVLPGMQTMDLWIPAHESLAYGALVTAVDPDAPSLFPWEPSVSWYVYDHGSLPQAWGLIGASWCPVTALALHPALWRRQDTHVPTRHTLFVLLEGAKDTHYTKGALFFPELLRSEYHGVRATLEAYAQDAVLTGQDEANACGLIVTKDSNASSPWQARVNGQEEYLIDRWA